jgi:GNAT superfamily N-acetyltransferase
LEEDKLDSPVWHSLEETHQPFSLSYEGAKFYDPSYCSFGSFASAEKSEFVTREYSAVCSDFYVVGDQPRCSGQLRINKNNVCNQMIIKHSPTNKVTERIVELSHADQKQELIDLVNLVQPGFIKEKTPSLGTYFGVYKNKSLVAAAGERMKMNHFTEISAVVTHPQCVRNGYAKQLLKHLVDSILIQNKTPYLHVSETNLNAVKLYHSLGFTIRRNISFWHIVKS